jgi:hypothetical protein
MAQNQSKSTVPFRVTIATVNQWGTPKVIKDFAKTSDAWSNLLCRPRKLVKGFRKSAGSV